MQHDTKTCKTCCVEKSLNEFAKNKGGKFGRHSKCNACKSDYEKIHRAKDPVRTKEMDRLNRIRNRDKKREYNAKWVKDNPEKIQIIQKRYCQSHTKDRTESVLRWRNQNPEKYRMAVERDNEKSRIATQLKHLGDESEGWMI